MLGIAALVVAVGCTGVLVARQLSSNAPERINVGLPSNFEPNSVMKVSTAAEPFWIVRSTAYDGLDTIYALRGTCPGAGEVAIWSEETQTFRCPGSASHYAISGRPIKGPGRRALERYRVALTENGQIVVDTSEEFREELGQWADPESFVRFPSGEASLR
ncbi:QcrA and Rieske domain-containing protein [Tautonia marina]|uniref:QcrA and Rieske domain-containing protein n=1 Tax=Tautonia marina TaxID=2653855 RepID=UPI0012605C03|nr:Rieske (2Fe-2S) protein [Tautonia marina]